MTDAKSEREIALFQDFANLLGLAVGAASNPNENGPETGMDVATFLNGKRIGVQLTDYHADEDRTAGSRGQTLRSQEQKKAKQALTLSGPKVYGTWAPGAFIPPLLHRVRDKIEKADKHMPSIDELWLLVCAQDGRFGATGSTFIASTVVSLDVLDQHLNPLLSASRFDKMFLFLSLERVVYGWTKKSNRWNVLKDKPKLDEARVAEMQEILFGRRNR